MLMAHENEAPDMQYEPGSHGVWLPAVDPAGQMYPAWQALQDVTIPRLKDPAPHCTGTTLADAHENPGGQGVHAVCPARL